MSLAYLRCNLGDLPIITGSLRLPARDAWYAAVDVHAPSADAVVTGAAAIVFTRENGAEDRFIGAVLQSELDPGALELAIVVVAGAGKLDEILEPADHANSEHEIPAGLIARDMVTAAGEQLADGVEEQLDARTVRRWTSFAGTLRSELTLLAGLLGLTWRFTPEGKVWLGLDAFEAGASGQRVAFELGDGAVTIRTDGAPALPGTTCTARGEPATEVRAIEVTYQIGASVRASLRAAVPGDPQPVLELDRYARTYAARVVSQDADGLLEVVADDAELGTLRAVPLRCGIPGARIAFSQPSGERVRIAFEGGLPTGAYAVPAHDQAPADAAVKGVARVGDTVACGTLTGTVLVAGVPTPVTFTFTPSGTSSPEIGVSATIRGAIRSGSSEVKIR